MNGLADVERHELRAVSAYGFYDDPTRLLRLVRLRVRLGFTIEERTRMQVANAREAGVEASIPPRAVSAELKLISAEDSPAEIMRGLEEEGLVAACLPALAGHKLNLAGLAKLDKINRLLPDDPPTRAARLGPFLYALTEKLTPKEKQALVKALEVPRADLDAWQKIEARSKKLETALRSARIRKASQVYQIVVGAPPDQVMFLLYHSALKPVQERLRAFYQKYLPAIQEIPPEEWPAFEAKPGSPRYQKARDEFIANRLDRRAPRKPPLEPPPPAPQPVAPEQLQVRRAR
jgi:tRNA nucleotidyltransferase/poly(A) polymerase